SRRNLSRQKKLTWQRRTGERKGAACGVPFTLAGTRATVLQKRPRKGLMRDSHRRDEQEHTRHGVTPGRP
ncbi:hypothetical protein, partial [Serratia marcescens]|uniref:hypothetical protein n=1 Tax=Serratia marcescens TaxID=615 RepID=UPI003A894445